MQQTYQAKASVTEEIDGETYVADEVYITHAANPQEASQKFNQLASWNSGEFEGGGWRNVTIKEFDIIQSYQNLEVGDYVQLRHFFGIIIDVIGEQKSPDGLPLWYTVKIRWIQESPIKFYNETFFEMRHGTNTGEPLRKISKEQAELLTNLTKVI